MNSQSQYKDYLLARPGLSHLCGSIRYYNVIGSHGAIAVLRGKAAQWDARVKKLAQPESCVANDKDDNKDYMPVHRYHHQRRWQRSRRRRQRKTRTTTAIADIPHALYKKLFKSSKRARMTSICTSSVGHCISTVGWTLYIHCTSTADHCISSVVSATFCWSKHCYTKCSAMHNT